MKTAVCTLKSASAYSQSRHYTDEVPKLNKESPSDYEKRTWRDRCHFNEAGNVIIPPMSFKKCLEESAQFLGEKIQGKGQSTWSKHFLAGVLVLEPLVLPVKKEELKCEWLYVPSDGKRGGPKRVSKCFPIIHEWSGKITFTILDELITEDVFKHHLEQAGTFIGIGRFRPRNGGFYGRFIVEKVKWQ
jgi:hypothetical protein